MYALSDMAKYLVQRCAQKNDEFRESLPINAIIHDLNFKLSTKKITPDGFYHFKNFNGALRISPLVFERGNTWPILKAIKSYQDFDKNNDPMGEHSFGDLYIDGQIVFWKIEHYQDNEEVFYKDNYLNENSWRVLTIYDNVEY